MCINSLSLKFYFSILIYHQKKFVKYFQPNFNLPVKKNLSFHNFISEEDMEKNFSNYLKLSFKT